MSGFGRSNRAFIRRLDHRDTYGRQHEDRHVEGWSDLPAKRALMVFMVLAGFVVLASMIH
jgi:hypothetical protein